MQTVDNHLTQPEFTPPGESTPTEVGKSFSLTRRQLILVGIVGGLVLLLIFGLGVRAGEKRALRRQSVPQTQPTPTNAQPSPVAPSPSSTPVQPSPENQPTPPPESSGESDEGGPRSQDYVVPESGKRGSCWKCIERGDEEVCDWGNWQNGVCVW